jgi:hypothetical protein
MDFEFDSGKSDGNLKKHGIDFVTAQAFWRRPGPPRDPCPIARRASAPGHWPDRQPGVVGLHHHAARPHSDDFGQASTR